MPGQIALELLRHTDWPHARPTAAVGNAERLVQIQVTDIRAEFRKLAQAYECVHVGAIQIDLTAVFVHEAADLLDRSFKNAVR